MAAQEQWYLSEEQSYSLSENLKETYLYLTEMKGMIRSNPKKMSRLTVKKA